MLATHGRSGCGAALVDRDRDQAGPRRDARDLFVEVAGLTQQRPVHGVDRRRRHGSRDHRRGWARVIGDHVELGGALEARERMAKLHLSEADLVARRRLVDVRELCERVGVAGGEEGDVVARSDEAVGEQRHDPLDAAVAGRRHREPHRREDGDLHACSTATTPSSRRTSQCRSKARTPESLIVPSQSGTRAARRSRARGGRLSGRRPSSSDEQQDGRAGRPRLRARGRRVGDRERRLVPRAARRTPPAAGCRTSAAASSIARAMRCASGQRPLRASPAAQRELSCGQTVPLW